MRRRGNDGLEHSDMTELIPWYLNSTIGEVDRERLEGHLVDCANCRATLELERRVHRGMTAQASVEYIPAASLKRLQARLDGIEFSAKASIARPGGRSIPWQGLMAASIAVLSVAVALIAADRWTHFPNRSSGGTYATVSHSRPRARGEAIRAVFAPTLTLVELQLILDEAQMKIIAGPSEAGVDSLASTSGRPVGASLTLLRSHPDVRFAESTEPVSSRPKSRADDGP